MKKAWKKALASLRTDGSVSLAANRAGLSAEAVASRVRSSEEFQVARDHGLAYRRDADARDRQRAINKAADDADRARRELAELRQALNRDLPTLGRHSIELRVRQIENADAKLHAFVKHLRQLQAKGASSGS